MLISDIKPHERLYIHRLRTGKSQSSFALEHGIDYTLYRHIEKGWARDSADLFNICQDLELIPREQAIILRRRTGQTQTAIARQMGITRGWLVQMETGKGNSNSLISYWQNQLAL